MYGNFDPKIMNEQRDHLLEFPSNFDLLQDEVALLDYVERGVLEPYEAALLMCPVQPSKCTGYRKLINKSHYVFQEYLDHIEDVGAHSDPAFFTSCVDQIRTIWGLFEEIDDDATQLI